MTRGIDAGASASPLNTVADYPDEQLLARVMRGLDHPSSMGQPMWVVVQRTFGLGRTYSVQLCQRFGIDPDKRVVCHD